MLTDAPNGAPVDDDCVLATEGMARLIESQGHTLVDVSADAIGQRISDLYLFTIIETALHTMDWDHPELAEPYIRYRMERAAKRSAADYVRSVKEMQLESRRVVAHWGRDFDLLLTPTLATRVPPADLLLPEANWILDGSNVREAQMMAFMVFGNVTGLPAISIPGGYDRDGMPVGVQLVGGPFAEAELIRVAARLEAELQWQREHPQIFAGSNSQTVPQIA